MPSFIDIPNGKTPAAAFDVQQVIDALKGTIGKGIPLSPTAVNDAIAYALSVKNIDASGSRALAVYGADGTPLLTVDKNGVQSSAYGANALAPVVTTSQTQTLANKTLSAPTISGGLQVATGNVGIGQGPSSNTGIAQAGSLNAAFGAAISQAMTNTLVASVANDSLMGLVVENTYNPNGQTGVISRGIYVPPVTGAADTNIGVDVGASSGATNNIGVRIANMARALEIGTNPAQTQMINLPNNVGIGFRNFANNGDLTLGVDNANRLVIGTTGQIWANGGPAGAATGSLIVVINGVQRNINYT